MRPWSTQCDLTDKLQQQHTVTMTKKKNPYAAAPAAPRARVIPPVPLRRRREARPAAPLAEIHYRWLWPCHLRAAKRNDDPRAAYDNQKDWQKKSAASSICCSTRLGRIIQEKVSLCEATEEPRYKLDVICGAEEPKSYHWRSYHANFLASANGTNVLNGGEANPPVRKLFFAEFWDSQSGRFNKSNSKPICFPVQNYNACFGRLCSFCDEPRTILHPPCATGSHSNDDDDADADVIPDYNVDDAIRMYGSVAPELSEGRDLVESDTRKGCC
ncbi:hypothetical protein OsI_37140 [Oryza sativa Indica Group]|uniref:DUF3615 domain-containing protein n=1 Tax=Oryza sativa subsp. indica TaxID=39946 RepID=B8BNS7_ORYSI|nr:hypothetical protein OsI_37140 [Oryza sativa Indica Group]